MSLWFGKNGQSFNFFNLFSSLLAICHSISWKGLIVMGLFPKYGDKGTWREEQQLYVHATCSTSLKVTKSLKLNTDGIVILGN